MVGVTVLYRKYIARKNLKIFLKDPSHQNFISLRSTINNLDQQTLKQIITWGDVDESTVLLTASRFNSIAAMFFLELITSRLPERAQGRIITHRDREGWNFLQNAAHDNHELVPSLLPIISSLDPVIQREVFTNITNDGRGTLEIAEQSNKDTADLIRDAMTQVDPIPPRAHGGSLHFFAGKTPFKSVISNVSENKNKAKDKGYGNCTKENSSLLVPLIGKYNRELKTYPATIDEHTSEPQANHKKYKKMI